MRRNRNEDIASTTASDLRAMAQDMLRMGTHWAQAAQGWLDRTAQNLDERGDRRRGRCASGRHGANDTRGARDYQSDYSGGGYDQVDRGSGFQAGFSTPAGFGAASVGVRNYEREATGSQGGGYRSGYRGGGYRGVGPSNYSRSDERIREDLNERLTEADDLDASGITVEVSNGIATLGGVVEQRWMKHRAEDLAEGCIGVRDVRNQIRVGDDSRHSMGQSATQPSASQQATTGGGAEAHGSVRLGDTSAEVHGSMATGVGNSAGGASPGAASGASGARTSTGTNTRQGH